MFEYSQKMDRLLVGFDRMRDDMGHTSDPPKFPVKSLAEVKAMDGLMGRDKGFCSLVVRIMFAEKGATNS